MNEEQITMTGTMNGETFAMMEPTQRGTSATTIRSTSLQMLRRSWFPSLQMFFVHGSRRCEALFAEAIQGQNPIHSLAYHYSTKSNEGDLIVAFYWVFKYLKRI